MPRRIVQRLPGTKSRKRKPDAAGKNKVEKMTPDWQDSKGGLIERAAHVLETGDLSDVEFLVGSEGKARLVSAHKLILSMWSPVFAAMFRQPWEANRPIKVIDITPNIFSKMLKYMYEDEFGVVGSLEEVLELYYAAEKYAIPMLKYDCNNYFQSQQIFAENVCGILERANSLGIEFVRERCLRFISASTSDVLKSAGFLNAKQETVQRILAMDKVSVSSEAEFFTALLAWGRTECRRKNLQDNSTNLRRVVVPLLPLIHFLTMSDKEFRKAGEDAGDLFNSAEIISVYLKIVNISSKHSESLPNWCNNSLTKRVSIDRVFAITLENFLLSHDSKLIQRSITSGICLESCRNGLVIKGIALQWIQFHRLEESSCNKNPQKYYCMLEATNPATDVKVLTRSTVFNGNGVKLIFPEFIAVAMGEKAYISVSVGVDEFVNSRYIAEGKQDNNDLIITSSCHDIRNRFLVLKEVIYFLNN